MLTFSYWQRAAVFEHLGRFAEAVTDWDRTVVLSPPDERAKFRAFRAYSLLRSGQVERAVAEVDELTTPPVEFDSDRWYAFACVYSVASSKSTDRHEHEKYAAIAVELLSKAVSSGFRNRTYMLSDADLAPLRNRSDFQIMLNSLPELAPRPRPAK